MTLVFNFDDIGYDIKQNLTNDNIIILTSYLGNKERDFIIPKEVLIRLLKEEGILCDN